MAIAMATSLFSMEATYFAPEKGEFSKKANLEKWLSGNVQSDSEEMKKIQKWVSFEVPENPFSFNFIRPIRNNKGEERYFGKSFYSLYSVQQPFLEFVHQISKKKDPVVLEIAAANGLVTWKIPYAFENIGTVYANDLSSEMLNTDFESIMKGRLKDNQCSMVHKIPGDCFELDKRSELVGKVDAIFVQNLEHFFNPEQHQKFIKLLNILLADHGRAFLASNTITADTAKKGNPVFELYLKNKKSLIYPGFTQYTGTLESSDAGLLFGNINFLDAIRPSDTTICSTTTTKRLGNRQISTQHGVQTITKVEQIIITNFYTPQIYRESIKSFPSLKMVDTFFMDQSGHKHDKFGNDLITHAVAIIEKTTSH